MPQPMIEVLAMVDKSMEMKLPMTVKLHEVPILRAVYAGAVKVLFYRTTDEIVDGPTEMERMSKSYGQNPTGKQPWAESIFGAYGGGANALVNFYEDDGELVRQELLDGAEPFPDSLEPFENETTGKVEIPNLGDVGTASDPQRLKAKATKPAKTKRATAASADA